MYPFFTNFKERRWISMSLLIRVIVVVLFALLAIGIGLLVLVCWALAACAGRREHYRQRDYRVK